MPTVNISPKVRFVLYLLAVLGGLFVQYTLDKSWFGEAEFRLWSGIATLLMLLAAAKTNLSDSVSTGTAVVVEETPPRDADDLVDPDDDPALVDDDYYDGLHENRSDVPKGGYPI